VAHLPDLFVAPRWETLRGKTLDIAVSGSIAAVEAPRFLRCLRRLGAEVVPWLSSGGAQFITETSLSWASGGHQVVRDFSGSASHIATNDALIIAPASANLLSKISLGLTDSPITALAASYLGQGKPVLVLPTMHSSLAASPFIQENIRRLSPLVTLLQGRREEGKIKFPSPRLLADRVSHLLNRTKWQHGENVVITMGSTRGYIDEVRYISNYSTGRLGSLIAEELYRRGLETKVITGPCTSRPRVYSSLIEVETNEEMCAASVAACERPYAAGVFAAAVLDFVPINKVGGKIKSSQKTLRVDMGPGIKVIAACHPPSGIKVGFKLEIDPRQHDAEAIARTYILREKLSFLVLNFLQEIAGSRHRAAFFIPAADGGVLEIGRAASKKQIAAAIATHIEARLSAMGAAG
jgi:phosphopantothenoylcysteine decarboxylase/phosphopantothenate--cysteine ligase